MDHDRLKYLLDRYKANACNEAELAALNDWFHAYNPGAGDMHAWLQEYETREDLSTELFQDFTARMDRPFKMAVVPFGNIYRIAAAAAVVVAAIILFNPYKQSATRETAQLNKQKAAPAIAEIKPGCNKATLTLADGSSIALSDSAKGAIAVQNSTQINQVDNGSIAYNELNRDATQEKLVYNTLTTPRGGKYTLTLADGTVVTLDAASSITYPVAFADKKERLVKITGQAYFEVVHNAGQPFRVSAKGQTIEDIGTEFNINAYDDDPCIKVTLAQGKAAVRNAAGSVSLAPGQQARINDGQQNIAVKYVNVEETVAWKNGWFMLRNISIQDVMKQAARWYDVDIEFEGAPINKEFGGSISKYKDISELLQNLKLTGGINYKIEGRKVTLMN